MKYLLSVVLLGIFFIQCGNEEENESGPPSISLTIVGGGSLDKIENKVAFIERTGGSIPLELEFSTPDLYDRSTYRSQFGIGPAFNSGDVDVSEDKKSGTFSVQYPGPEFIQATGEVGTFAVYDQMGQKDSLTINFSK